MGNSDCSSSGSCSSAVELLKEDHCAVRKLFADYEQAGDYKKKEEIVGQISLALTLFANMENEIVYKAMKPEGCDEPCEGSESHHQVKLILDQLGRLTADIDAEAYDKSVCELKAAVEKHLAEEEKSLLPEIQKSGDRLEKLAEQMKSFKSEYKPQLVK
jgi:hypothetical protein